MLRLTLPMKFHVNILTLYGHLAWNSSAEMLDVFNKQWGVWSGYTLFAYILIFVYDGSKYMNHGEQKCTRIKYPEWYGLHRFTIGLDKQIFWA